MIKNTVIKVYSFDDTIKSLVHELRKIGVNLNQLAYMANSGREYQAVSELREMSKQHNIVMESIKEFLEHPILNASVHNTDGD